MIRCDWYFESAGSKWETSDLIADRSCQGKHTWWLEVNDLWLLQSVLFYQARSVGDATCCNLEHGQTMRAMWDVGWGSLEKLLPGLLSATA